MRWKEPELPPIQRMPRRRPEKRPSLFGRAIAGIAGLSLVLSAVVGLSRALGDGSGRASPFGPLALLIPSVVLIRYALTGKIKV